LRFVIRTLLFTLAFAGVLAVQLVRGGQPIDALPLFQSLLMNPAYQLVLLLLVFIHGRIVLFRLDDKEVVQR